MEHLSVRAMEFSLRFDDVRGLGQKEPAGCTRRETYSDGAPACPGGFGRVPSCAVRWVCAHPRAELCFASPKLGYMGGTGGYSFTISLARVRHFLNARFPVFPPVGSSVRIRGCKLAHGVRTRARVDIGMPHNAPTLRRQLLRKPTPRCRGGSRCDN